MRHTVLAERGSRFVPLRPEFARICDGSPAATALLAVFDFHTAARFNDEDNRESHGDDAHPMGRWIKAGVPWLTDELCGLFGERAIRSGLDLLIEKGYLSKQANPDRKLDRALWYRLNLDELHTAIQDDPVFTDAPIPANAGMEPTHAGVEAGDRSDHARTRSGGEPGGEPPSSGSDIEIVWAHFVKVMNASRQTLDSKRKTIIRNALKVRSVEECQRAIDGLSVSPFHNGDNDQKKKYLHLRYALAGIGAESNDERIDKMIDIADEHGGVLRGGKLPSDHPRIKRWLRAVQVAWHSKTEMSRGRESLISLRQSGYDVEKLDEAPWVKLVVKAA